jgi:hypothetical protein
MAGVSFLVGEKDLSVLQHLDHLWGVLSFLSNGYQELFPRFKPAGA